MNVSRNFLRVSGEQVRALRRSAVKRGVAPMSMSGLSLGAGISREYVRQIEGRAVSRVDSAIVERLAYTLRVDLPELLAADESDADSDANGAVA